MATAYSVANELIRLAQAENKQLTPLQIMKMAYLAHGWMLALYQRALFPNRIEAWKYGPVVPDLYHVMKRYGSGPVTGPLRPSIFHGHEPPLDNQESNLIGQVYRLYGGMNGMQLSALTHRPGTPWAQTWSPDVWNLAIPNDMIAEYYRLLANERPSSPQ